MGLRWRFQVPSAPALFIQFSITSERGRFTAMKASTTQSGVIKAVIRSRFMAAGSAVQVRVDEPKGMSAMNPGDFAAEAVQAALQNAHYAEPPEIKRAFRYHDLPAEVTLHAETVLPELRVTEQASLDISDERLVLSTRLEIAISRAGVFDLRLDLPEAFDIESLTGDEISHWDGYGYVLINDDVEGCFEEVRAILRAERLTRRRQIGLIGFARDLIRSVPEADPTL